MRSALAQFLSTLSSESSQDSAHSIATVTIASRHITLFFTNADVYHEYLPALIHQQIEVTREADLAVTISNNRSHPLPIDIEQALAQDGKNIPRADAPIIVHRYENESVSCHFDSGTLAALYYYDKSSQRACAWVNSELQPAEPMSVSAPLRTVLSWFFESEGFVLLHAGGVAVSKRSGVLFCGPSGSGKSSCSLISISGETRMAGDDSVLVEKSGYMHVHSLYCSARIPPIDRHHYSFLDSAQLGKTTLKSNFYLNNVCSEHLISSFRLGALVFPAVDGRISPQIEPLSKIEALRSLSASNLYHVPGRDIAPLFTTLSNLVANTPCFRLWLGHDRRGIRPIIVNLCTNGAN